MSFAEFLQCCFGAFVALRSGFFEPLVGFADVTRYTLAVVVEDAEVVLGIGITLGGSLFVPRTRLTVILYNA